MPKDLPMYDTDLKKAKEELALAKGAFPEEFKRPMTIKVLKGYTNIKLTALYLQSAAAELGIEMRIEEEPWTLLTGAARDLRPPRHLDSLGNTFFLDQKTGFDFYSSTYHGSYMGSTFYKNEKVDKLLDKARTSINREERRSLYEEATRLIVGDAPDIWISNDKYNGTFTADVQGWRFCDIGEDRNSTRCGGSSFNVGADRCLNGRIQPNCDQEKELVMEKRKSILARFQDGLF